MFFYTKERYIKYTRVCDILTCVCCVWTSVRFARMTEKHTLGWAWVCLTPANTLVFLPRGIRVFDPNCTCVWSMCV